ncbi:MAG: aspartate carbamoyltransferase regulatory subunit, partial [Clostridiales Family XIII bacterium]|nr:aspartate carbamoyltransferase regulatory subunit [Clostridiales Family XIII bacterium]
MAVLGSIENGIVIDHIKAGLGLKIINYLKIDPNKDTVSLIMNANSKRQGRKDIIKIENIIDYDITALGFIDSTATVNIIKDKKVIKKIKLELPEKIIDIIKCKNPRCVTSVEP